MSGEGSLLYSGSFEAFMAKIIEKSNLEDNFRYHAPSTGRKKKLTPGSRTVVQQGVFYLSVAPAVCCSVSTFCQLLSGLNALIDFAVASVFLPRSFSNTVPSVPTTNVFTPEDR